MDTRRDFIYVDDLVDVVMKAIDGGGTRGRVPRLLRRDYSIKELFDETVGGLEVVARRSRSKSARAIPTTSFTILLDPSKTRARLRLEGNDAARGRACAPRSSTTATYGIDADVHAPRASTSRSRRDAMREFDGSSALVVGGAGFVGSNLVRELLRRGRGATFIVVDNLLSAERENVPVDASGRVHRRLDRRRRRA